MATSATVIAAWSDGTYANLAVTVAGDNPSGTVEYIGRTLLLTVDGSAKPLSQLKAECVAACKTQRDAQRLSTTTIVITGAITL